MDEELKDKEDVIEDQNDSEESADDTIEDKEDVIEDQEDYDKGKEDSILKAVDSLHELMMDIRAELISVKDTVSMFVDAGGVIREADDTVIVDDVDDDGDIDYIPIEELDLNL